MKKIALVWPKGYDKTYSIPLPFGYLKSNLDDSRYELMIIDNTLHDRNAEDRAFQQELSNFEPDVVGVSTWSPMFLEALQCLKIAKSLNPYVITCLGGAHASTYYERIMGTEAVDFIFRGEAELTFPKFLDEIEKAVPKFSEVKGLVYRNGENFVANDPDREENLDLIKRPDYDAIRLDYYVDNGYRWNSPPKVNAPVWVTRGCPYRCQFCAAPDLNGRPVRTHSIEYMMDWIQDLYHNRGVRWINIIDDNFTYHKKYAKEFCREVIKLDLDGLHFGTPNGIRLQRGDPELWELMKRAGWKILVVAPETNFRKR